MKDETLKARVSQALAAEIKDEARIRDVPVSQVIRDRLTGRLAPKGAPEGAGSPEVTVRIETEDCPHPKARLRPYLKGKRCLDCKAVFP